jgi:hypothetical protein
VAQIFSRTADTWFRAAIVAVLALAIGSLVVAGVYARSQYETSVAQTPLQPVPFSHKHHAGELGIDCRYCHTTVERSADAGFPPTHVCMTCHSQIWTNAEMLAPVRESLAGDQSLVWRRVARVPDYVYFRHDIHIAKGIACVECHGRIDKMPLTFRAKPFEMRFCLECHRDPAPHLRPHDAVFQMDWKPPPDEAALEQKLMRLYRIHSPATLTQCGVCHR